MADVYTPPPSFAYALLTPFDMPSNKGDRWAVSFSGNGATLVAAALSVAVTVAFLLLWNLVCFIAMFFDGNSSRRRYVALVTLWNSNDSWFAFKELLSYTYQCATLAKTGSTWADLTYGLAFCLLALAMFAGSIVMGIIGPSLIQIGNVAPVLPETLFYPRTPLDNAVQKLQDFGLRAPAVMRALGSVEAARVTARERVLVKDEAFDKRADGDQVMGLTYSYSLSGVELGLQGGDGLEFTAEGSCITEYGWAVDSPPEDEMDLYNLWGDPKQQAWALLNYYDTRHAPTASFRLHPDTVKQIFRDSNVSYAVFVDSAWRSSISEGSDPWYATERRPELDDSDRFNAGWRMKRRRPVLSCWEKDTWAYRGQVVNSVFDLKNLPGMAIPQILLEVLETTFGSGPMIVRLGNASGDSALRSRTTSPNGVINAQASRIYDDMERLILASFVATRSLFTDATMFGRAEGDYPNLFTADNGKPATGAGNFVVSSPDIQTFSLTGIVTLAAILLALLVADTVVWLLVRINTDSNSNGTTSKWTRFHVLAAAQLFRCIYETGVDSNEKAGWACSKHIPDAEDEFKLAGCSAKNSHRCLGHIDKRVLVPTNTGSSTSGSSPGAGVDGKNGATRAAPGPGTGVDKKNGVESGVTSV